VANLVPTDPVKVSDLAAAQNDNQFVTRMAWFTTRVYQHLADAYDFLIFTSDQAALPASAGYYGRSTQKPQHHSGAGLHRQSGYDVRFGRQAAACGASRDS